MVQATFEELSETVVTPADPPAMYVPDGFAMSPGQQVANQHRRHLSIAPTVATLEPRVPASGASVFQQLLSRRSILFYQ